MRNLLKSWSGLAVLFSVLMAIVIRLNYFTNKSVNGYNATTWDAFGYYAYLPAALIYKDVKHLKWYPAIEQKYHVSGGLFYQADTLENGNLTFKYLGGVAVMQTPFFLIGHGIAHATDTPADGFSWPYQYAIIWGALFYFFIGLIILRKVLLHYFSDVIVSWTIFLVALATNLMQYAAVDGAMSHIYIFPLYALVLLLTIRWMETERRHFAFYIGVIIGLATISRPTELIMFFIPLLWLPQNMPTWKAKKEFFKRNKSHFIWVSLGGLLGMFPQLMYWKYTTGSWVHNVGSKWTFLNPWWRVLIGFEKGWFIYTPIAIAMVVGLFLMKNKPYRKSILTFGLLNIWVIISWWDWRYGASYSTRALTQSYPVYAFGLATVLSRIQSLSWKRFAYGISVYLIGLNLFQLWQYNASILHFDHMNARYYRAIYLDADPTPLDYSLLDSFTVIPKNYQSISDAKYSVKNTTVNWNLELFQWKRSKGNVLHVQSKLKTKKGLMTSTWRLDCYHGKELIQSIPVRCIVPFAEDNKTMHYEAFISLPPKTTFLTWNLGTFSGVQVNELQLKAELVNASY